MNRRLKMFIYSFTEFWNAYVRKSLLIAGSLAGIIALVVVVSSC